MSFAGRKTPAFIISINAVPPATGRIVSSLGSSSLIASENVMGSASSNWIIAYPCITKNRGQEKRLAGLAQENRVFSAKSTLACEAKGELEHVKRPVLELDRRSQQCPCCRMKHRLAGPIDM